MTDLLSPSVPDGWGLYWEHSAFDADLEAMRTALEQAVERATALEARSPTRPRVPRMASRKS